MEQYSRSAPKLLALAASLVASIHGTSALAEAVAKPSARLLVGQVCATEAARLARAVFSPQAGLRLGAECDRPVGLATPAQARVVALLGSSPLATARITAPAISPVGADALTQPLTTAGGLAPSGADPSVQPSSRDSDGSDFETYRRQGPISTFAQDDAPVGLKLSLAF